MPVVHQSSGDNHQCPFEFTLTNQFPENERRFNGFAQPDFVGDEKAAWRGGGNAAREHDLVRERINFGGCQGLVLFFALFRRADVGPMLLNSRNNSAFNSFSDGRCTLYRLAKIFFCWSSPSV